jgi:FdhD protein
MTDPNRKAIWQWSEGATPRAASDDLAGEEPLEIRVDGRAISVTMRTPGEDAELAAGFLLTEGLVRGPDDIEGVEPARPVESCNVVDVRLAPHVAVDFARLTRHVFASSSCGLCGKASIDAVHQHFPPVTAALTVAVPTLLALPERLRAAQTGFARTGGLHAAGVFDAAGQLVMLREDVGRHNAVDKAVGWALLNRRLPFDRHVLLVSGRASFEIMQKALAARIPIVAAVSAASTLAVQFAAESGQTLVGFLRPPTFNVYAGPERIKIGKP